MFWAFSRPASGAQWLQWQPLVLPSYRGDSRAVSQTQHGYHHDTKVNPEAATAVIELLMMGGKTPKTCWVVNKRQDNKLENVCIWLVIYLNCTMMHGLTNLKFKKKHYVVYIHLLFLAIHITHIILHIYLFCTYQQILIARVIVGDSRLHGEWRVRTVAMK
jgi:hypothetical protein